MLRAAFLSFALFAGFLPAQSTWTLDPADGNGVRDTLVIHSGQQGGTHENIQVTNNATADSKVGDVTLRVVFFVWDEKLEEWIDKELDIAIPEGQTASFHGDVKSATIVGDDDAATNGTHQVTYP